MAKDLILSKLRRAGCIWLMVYVVVLPVCVMCFICI